MRPDPSPQPTATATIPVPEEPEANLTATAVIAAMNETAAAIDVTQTALAEATSGAAQAAQLTQAAELEGTMQAIQATQTAQARARNTPRPEPTDTPRPQRVVSQPSILSRSSWNARSAQWGMTSHTPERIVFTHEGGAVCCDGENPATRVRGNQLVHMNDVGWPDIAFHYIVAPDGRIYEGRDDNFQSNSSYARINSGYDLDGTLVVGILGHYDNQQPTRAGLAAAEELIAWLCQEYDLPTSRVYYFRDLAPNDVSGGATTSPGRNMPSIEQFRNNVEAILRD
jgi:hypothetical protein